MPLYYLLVDKRMESVLEVHEYRRSLNARSLDEYASALLLCYTLYSPCMHIIVITYKSMLLRPPILCSAPNGGYGGL